MFHRSATHLPTLAAAAALAVFAVSGAACAAAARPAAAAPVVAKISAATSAQAVQPSAIFRQRAEELIEVYNGQRELISIAADPPNGRTKQGLTKAEVSVAARKMFDRLRGRAGPAVGISHIVAETPYKGDVFVDLEKSQVRVPLTIDATAPHMLRAFSVDVNPAGAKRGR